MSLFADYKKEREGKEILENEYGFITYIINGDSVYIEDIYVVPEQRRLGVGGKMADIVCEIAKQRGCKTLYGSVSPQARGAHESMIALIAYGMKLHSLGNGLIYFSKDIK